MGKNDVIHLEHEIDTTFLSDLYSVIKYGSLLPADHMDPADYTPVGTRELEHGGDSTVDDICDFIIEYINSDVLVRIRALIRSFPLNRSS